MEGRMQIDRVGVRNFRSIQECDVELAPLTFFVGANASGKTNFVDAILFVSSAVKDSLQKAIANRGGIGSIVRRAVSFPATIRFDIRLSLQDGFRAEFHLELQVTEDWAVTVAREECSVQDEEGGQQFYVVENGQVRGSAAVFPAVSVDRIYLSNASGLPEFRPVFDFLAGVVWMEPMPRQVMYAMERLGGAFWSLGLQHELVEMGLAPRFLKLSRLQPERFEIVNQYLRAIAPPFDHIAVVESFGKLSVRFVEASNSEPLMELHMNQASAGLVNSAEILLDLFELPYDGRPPSPVIIEEPEAFLHPFAIQVMRDAFVESSRTRQVLVTTHSPDLLDDPEMPAEWVRAVHRDETGTHVNALDAATQSILRDHLYTSGELLRHGGLVLRS